VVRLWLDRDLGLEGRGASFRYGVILLAAAAGDAAGEDHNFAVIGGVNAEKLVSGLGSCPETFWPALFSAAAMMRRASAS
jgi:hypothetical protein